jgi:mRNA-degrading endonuclease RelE of RelBE toxin-antitoxin system
MERSKIQNLKMQIVFESKAEKMFFTLDKKIQRVFIDVFDKLEKDPFDDSLDIKKLKIPFDGYRVRKGNYRALYKLEKERIIIYKIGHRQGVYT